MKSDADALADAGDILSGDGWVKGAFHVDGGGRPVDKFDMNREKSCLLGALQLATEDEEQYVRLVKKVGGVIRRTVPGIHPSNADSVYGYNDAHDTTQEDVLLTLKRTREEAEAEEAEATE